MASFGFRIGFEIGFVLSATKAQRHRGKSNVKNGSRSSRINTDGVSYCVMRIAYCVCRCWMLEHRGAVVAVSRDAVPHRHVGIWGGERGAAGGRDSVPTVLRRTAGPE
jgi:hypothetical protein